MSCVVANIHRIMIVSGVLTMTMIYAALALFQVAGIVGGIAHVLSLGGARISHRVLTCLLAASHSALLVIGRYRLVERASGIMVC